MSVLRLTAVLVVLVLVVGGCNSQGEVEENRDVVDRARNGEQWPNTYGGITVYDRGYKSNASLMILDENNTLRCTVIVADSELWPQSFDPGNVVCEDVVHG